MAIVEQDHLGIRRIVAENDVETAVAIEVGERCGVAAVRLVGQRWPGREVALAVAEQDDVREGPVTAFSEHKIQVAVAVEVADADIGTSLGDSLERDRIREGSDGGREKTAGKEAGKKFHDGDTWKEGRR
jgi:hypothetical protein